MNVATQARSPRLAIERFCDALIAEAREAKLPLTEVARALEDGDVGMLAVAVARSIDERPPSSEARIQIARALRILGRAER